jgi:outer membrane protein TolC
MKHDPKILPAAAWVVVLCFGLAATAQDVQEAQPAQPPQAESSQAVAAGAVERAEAAIAAAAAATQEAAMPFEVVLDLETAQRRALADNPALQAAAERVAQAEQLAKQALSAYFPQVDLNYAITYTWLPESITGPADEALGQVQDAVGDLRNQFRFGTLGGNIPTQQRREIRQGFAQADAFLGDLREELDKPLEGFRGGVTAGYLVFDGFARRFRLAQARYGIEEVEAARRDGQRLLLSAVARAYHGVQLAQENMTIVRSDLAFNESLLADARVLRERGRGATTDVLNFEVAVSAARTAALEAQKQYESARIALATLMATPDAALPENVHVAPLADETPALMHTPEAKTLIGRALAQRPDIGRGELSVKRGEAAVRQEAAAFSPKVAAFVNYEAQRFNGFDLREDDFSTTVGVNVSYNLFSGGRRVAAVREKQHAMREAELHLRDRELQVASEVQQALLDLHMAQQQLVLQRTSLISVQKNRDLVAKSYDAGKEMLVRLNQAQRDLVRAQAWLALARVELQRTWYELETVTADNLARTDSAVETVEDRER